MNLHLKLKDNGFKPCGLYKKEYDAIYKKHKMVPNLDFIRKKGVVNTKGRKFYKFLSSGVTIWIEVFNQSVIRSIYIENDYGVSEIFANIYNIGDMLNLIPKDIKREIIINKISKKIRSS